MGEDLKLIDEVLNGNIDSFNILVNKYEADILKYVYCIIKNKYAAEDITQDIFLTVYNKLYTIKKETEFSTWLFKIARNKSMSFLKKYGMLPQINSEQPLQQINYKQKLQKFIFTLDDNDLQLIVLKNSSANFSCINIAQIMNLSEADVKIRYCSIIDKLKNNEQELNMEMQKCSNYTEVYGEEAAINSAIKEALTDLNIKFSKIRSEVIKKIDKRKYNKSVLKKLLYHFVKHFKAYAAALLSITFVLTQGFAYPVKNKTEISVPQFQKDTVTKQIETEDIFNEKASPDLKAVVGIYGRTNDGIEEGVGAIYINYKKGSKYLISIKNNQEQITPKIAEWFDNNHLLVIVGNAYGTITRGGQLYMVDVNSLKVIPVYLTDNLKKEVTAVNRTNDGYKLSINIYDDDEYIKCHTEEVFLDNSNILSVFKNN